MIVGPDFINSISENNIDISSAWIFTDVEAYSYDYKEVMLQPISSEAVPLTYLKFKVPVTNIEIRSGNTQTSPLLFAGVSFNISDEANESDNNTNSSVQQISTGVVGVSAPNAVYGAGTISIESAHVNLYSNSDLQGKIETYLITSATFTLTDGLEQYIVADYNSGSPIYRLENNKTNINSSNIVLVRMCWRSGNNVHSIDYDCAGSGLANKIEAAIIQTEPYKKSLDGGLVISETSTPIERTVLMTSSIVYAGTFAHSLSAFNSSINKLTFASISNGVWSYTSGTTQYNNTQYNPATGLSTLGNNNYGVVWFYRSVGNDVEVFYVLGSEEYPSLAKAETASVRSDLSLLLRDHCILCGRIIIQKGASSGVVENVSDVSFTSSQITNHNDLQNLQGGSVTTSEYYHLSAATYNKLTSGFNPAVRGLFSGTSPITYTSATGAISHSTTGSAGTYTKVVTNATGHVTFGSVLTSADIPSLDASKITTGTIDVARIPVLPSQVPQVTTNLASLTTTQQNIITSGTVVTTSDDGWRYVYSGTGSKTASASYVILADISPEWTAIANRPTNVSTWYNDAGYLTSASSLSWSKVTGTPTTLAGYGVAASDSLFASINAGTATKLQTARTIAGVSFDGSANISIPYANLTSIPSTFTPSAHNQAWSTITGTPTTISDYGITDAVGSSDSRLSDTRIPTNQSWYVIGDNASCTRSGSGTNSQNTLRKSGFYSYSTWDDSPVANTWTHLIHSQYHNDAGSTNTWSFDIAANFGSVAYPGSAENYYMRCIAGGGTTGWRKLWHDGNLTGDATGHYHSSDRVWGNITGVPANVQNPQNYYLSLSGGTLTGSISSKYSSLDTNYYSANGAYASWGHKSATNKTNYAILQNSTGTSTYLNAGTTLYLQVSDNDVATLTSTLFSLSKNLSVSQSAETAISVNASNSGYSRAFTALNSGLTAGGYYASLIGVALSNYNSGYIRFNYAGSGSTSNAMSLGLYGADNLLTINKDAANFSTSLSRGGYSVWDAGNLTGTQNGHTHEFLNLQNIPFAGATSFGMLTQADWNKFNDNATIGKRFQIERFGDLYGDSYNTAFSLVANISITDNAVMTYRGKYILYRYSIYGRSRIQIRDLSENVLAVPVDMTASSAGAGIDEIVVEIDVTSTGPTGKVNYCIYANSFGSYKILYAINQVTTKTTSAFGVKIYVQMLAQSSVGQDYTAPISGFLTANK